MKKPLQFLMSLMIAFMFSNVSAQGTTSKLDWSYASTCLKIDAKPSNYDSCNSITWVIGSSTTYTGSVLSHTFSAPGTYQVCMKYKNNCTKWDTTICKSVTVDTCPCSFTPYIVLTKDSADCYKYKYMAYPAGTSATGKYTYSVNFGDQTYSTARDGNHTYSKNGTYKVCVSVKFTNAAGKYCVKDYYKTITVNCAKKCSWITPSISYTNKCNAYKFSATDQKDSCVYYKWTIDSGNTTYGTVAEIKFKTKGYHKIKLTYYNSCTGCDTTLVKYIYDTCMTVCNWAGASMSYTKVNCYSFNYEASNLKDSCVTYTFIVGNKIINSNRTNSVYFTANGTYNVGYRFYNKCNGCDTIIWSKLEINCFSNKCNWPSNIGFTTTLVQCPYIKITANSNSDSCLVYKCYINDTMIPYYGSSGRIFAYKMPKNGTYKICMKISNTCTGCDTVICTTYTTNCIGASKCNWSNFGWNYSSNCRKYTFEATNTTDTCVSYTYKIGSNSGAYTYLNGRVSTYEFPANGTYTVCLYLKNKCKGCDTMICKTIVVNCSTTKTCNWNSPSFTYTRSSIDSCMYTFEAKNLNNYCITYKWYIGDSGNTNIFTGRLVQTKFGANGVQHVYLILNDTCNKCDTFIHREFTTNCYGVGLNTIEENQIKLHPNPSTTEFNITVKQTSTVIIYDQMGRIVNSFNLTVDKLSQKIQCAEWSTGVYFIQVTSNSNTQKIKFIKE